MSMTGVGRPESDHSTWAKTEAQKIGRQKAETKGFFIFEASQAKDGDRVEVSRWFNGKPAKVLRGVLTIRRQVDSDAPLEIKVGGTRVRFRCLNTLRVIASSGKK